MEKTHVNKPICDDPKAIIQLSFPDPVQLRRLLPTQDRPPSYINELMLSHRDHAFLHVSSIISSGKIAKGDNATPLNCYFIGFLYRIVVVHTESKQLEQQSRISFAYTSFLLPSQANRARSASTTVSST